MKQNETVYVKPEKGQTAVRIRHLGIQTKFCHFAQENVLKCLNILHSVYGTGRARTYCPNGACYSLLAYRQQLKVPHRLHRLCTLQNTKGFWHSSEATADGAKYLSQLVHQINEIFMY